MCCPRWRYPESSAEAYGSIRAELEARGEMIGNNDLWIAAHAVVAGLTLVTNNESEFQRVRGLKVQNRLTNLHDSLPRNIGAEL
jgi:predicted nucleic acid-binding protein